MATLDIESLVTGLAHQRSALMISVDLSCKTAVITGASQGLGEATARVLHRAGASVVVNYLPGTQRQADAERIAAELGDRGMAVGADVRQAAQVQSMLDQCVDRFGGIDIVVNNAAIIRDRTVRKMSAQEWQDVIDTDLTGVFTVCRTASEMLRDGGRIVNFASISGVVGFFGQANYAAAKAGVVAITKVLSKELAKRCITVNAVAPGVVLTEMGKTIPEEVRAKMLENIPLGRFAEPDEVARVVLFLCSDLSSYLTGQTLHVNGGLWG
jgi:3-oxoacyl-[acyl-carrier protein] reductase